jgi:DNA-binding NarL/FixJ family response regulator
MRRIDLYTEQPVLAYGLKALTNETGLCVDRVCDSPASLFAAVDPPADLLLLEASSSLTLETLGRLTSSPARTPVALWVDTVPHEFISQAISVGVRGVVRKTLPREGLIEALHTIASGGLWIEKDLSERLLFHRPIPLTARERQLVTLLAQGLKNKEIAWSLGITEGTVKVYLSRLFQKVGANDRFELALYALKSLCSNPAGDLELHSLGPRMNAESHAAPALPRLSGLGRLSHALNQAAGPAETVRPVEETRRRQ